MLRDRTHCCMFPETTRLRPEDIDGAVGVIREADIFIT